MPSVPELQDDASDPKTQSVTLSLASEATVKNMSFGEIFD
jgi:hypothetical protein